MKKWQFTHFVRVKAYLFLNLPDVANFTGKLSGYFLTFYGLEIHVYVNFTLILV